MNDQPQHLFGASQPGSNFVQLQVREVEVAEGVLVEEVSVLAYASEPGADGALPVAPRPVRQRKGPALRPTQRARRPPGTGVGCQTIQSKVPARTHHGAA